MSKEAMQMALEDLLIIWNESRPSVRALQTALAEQPAAPATLTDGDAARIWQSIATPHEVGKNLAPVVPTVAIQFAHAVLAVAIPPGCVVVPVEATDEWVEAYLAANAVYWHETDLLPAPPDKWRPGNPRDATKAGYRAAMLAARPGEKHEGS